MGMGGKAHPIGYVVIHVQVEGVPEYDEDQVAFVVDDNTTFSWRVPVVLGTPTINRVVAVMKESNLNNAPMEWQASKTSYELANGFLMRKLHLELEGFPTNTGKNPIDLDETVSLTSKCIASPSKSVIMHGRTQRTMMMDHRLNVMTQAPYLDDMVALPNGIYITRAYTDMKPSSRQVSVIIRNMTSRPIHLPQGKIVTHVVASNALPDAEPSPDLLKKLESDAPTKPRLSMEERHKLLITALEKDGGLERLKAWLSKLVAKVTRQLLEYHDIFSLEPHEIGCMDVTEHDIKLLDHEPFKERFRHIAPPLVEEVRQHIQEMLDGGAIHPSQSPWCIAVVLVRKKDGSLCFCINFQRLNAKTKKDSYPLPWMQETMESMVGTRYLLLHGPEERFLAGEDVGESPPVHCLHHGEHGCV